RGGSGLGDSPHVLAAAGRLLLGEQVPGTGPVPEEDPHVPAAGPAVRPRLAAAVPPAGRAGRGGRGAARGPGDRSGAAFPSTAQCQPAGRDPSRLRRLARLPTDPAPPGPPVGGTCPLRLPVSVPCRTTPALRQALIPIPVDPAQTGETRPGPSVRQSHLYA